MLCTVLSEFVLIKLIHIFEKYLDCLLHCMSLELVYLDVYFLGPYKIVHMILRLMTLFHFLSEILCHLSLLFTSYILRKVVNL